MGRGLDFISIFSPPSIFRLSARPVARLSNHQITLNAICILDPTYMYHTMYDNSPSPSILFIAIFVPLSNKDAGSSLEKHVWTFADLRAYPCYSNSELLCYSDSFSQLI